MTRTIELTRDEALVLFAFLSREVDDRDGRNLLPAFCDASEYWALNAVLCALEKAMEEPFAGDYDRLLLAARARLAPDPEESALLIVPAGSDDA